MNRDALTLGELLAQCDDLLRGAGVDSPRLSARLLAGHVLGLDQVRLVVDAGRVLEDGEVAAVRALAERRARGESVAYILGNKEFYGLDFRVTPDVLVPRPETEHLVERALERLDAGSAVRFADLGTGSGCLAVTLATVFPQGLGLALDVSAAALAVARGNALRHGVAGRLCFVRGDMGAAFARPGALDLVVSNPPYVSEAEYAELGFEVADFEPRGALVPAMPDGAPSDGLECYRALAPVAADALRPGGLLLLEIGCTQGTDVSEALRATGAFGEPEVLPDLAGLDRVVLARRV
ncbi:peptide chain release factor N(5)-glutamine methyltransferase [Desulfocurvus sp. DL9XJH121]